jgi:hypothetical protein
MANGPSRFARVRAQLRTARYAIAVASLGAFGGLVAVVRASHAAHGHHGAATLQAPAGFAQDSGSSFGFGDGSVAPADGSPSMQSSAS